MASLKRKFQKVNQELVRQNAALQDQLNRQRQEQNAVLQESVRLKSKIVALEARLQDGHDAVMELKRSIGERVEMLEAIGQHVLDLGKFLNVISRQDTAQQDQARADGIAAGHHHSAGSASTSAAESWLPAATASAEEARELATRIRGRE